MRIAITGATGSLGRHIVLPTPTPREARSPFVADDPRAAEKHDITRRAGTYEPEPRM